MPLDKTIKKVVVIGSGPIVIGQAAEFDYSGSQACKALKEEGVEIVLLNSNPATIQTDPTIADKIYIEPINLNSLEKIVQKEKPDGIIATMGGQTALNLAYEFGKKKLDKKYNCRFLGTGLKSIELAEDRGKFCEFLKKIGQPVLNSIAATTKEEAFEFAKDYPFPLILRPAYTLGGTGGGIAHNREEFEKLLELGFSLSPVHQVLIEENVLGWGEFEYEMVRDYADNCITICNMENIDPMGIHTGESVVVAPSQTLSDEEHQMLRTAAIKIIRGLNIVGGCNIQFAVNQETGQYVVVEVNPRLSRSSALASKATGYPIARVAAKLAIGYRLDEIKNMVTKTTPASFEPALDYVVVKIPRWPFDKMPYSNRTIGTQMKSTGEVMAIGRTFEQAFLKALSSLDQKLPNLSKEDIIFHMKTPTDYRFFAIFEGLKKGMSVKQITSITKINPWFIQKLKNIVKMEQTIKKFGLKKEVIKKAKKMGFSDSFIGKLCSKTEDEIRAFRKKYSILPTYKMVDTCAAEFQAKTPYYYSAYEEENESKPSSRKKIIVLGSGPIRIGQGIEFDYCCCHASYVLKEMGYESIIINNNPETISTDFDTSDKLYFEPLDFEHVMDVIELEKPEGVIVQFGGQTAINLAAELAKRGVKILGTSMESIDIAEDRELFRQFLNRLGLNQPKNATAISKEDALLKAEQIGYPIVVRPSYVIAGRGMQIVHDGQELEKYIDEAVEVSNNKPVLLDKYLEQALECEVDGISDGEEVWIANIMEHIERAGIHSGDASCVVPPVKLKKEVQEQIMQITTKMVKELKIIGAFNIQYIVKNDLVYVIELNPRGSRTMPFLSKALGIPIIKMATQLIVGKKLKELKLPEPTINYYAVKSVVFPFLKLPGADFILGPEMKSTGESMGIDKNFHIAYYKALLGANLKIPKKGTVAFSFKEGDKERCRPLAEKLLEMGFEIVATKGTAKYLEGLNIKVIKKISEGEPNIVSEIKNRKIDAVFNTPKKGGQPQTDGYAIRRAALEANILCITNFEAAEALVNAMYEIKDKELDVCDLKKYWANNKK
ncbi:MAG: carbamoyl-phosphate synthase large subunit [Candidatus Micrarchaeota archaeon]|nr:carbamoyl-phosphate synthase large subunit [Candidatus Micrarchaeota archaeon]